MKTSHRPMPASRHAISCLLVGAVISGGIFTPSAHAASKVWIGTSGDFWFTPTDWSPTGVPVNGDDVTLGTSIGAGANVNFTSTYTGAGLNSLTIDATHVGVLTLTQALSGSAMVATNEIIGNTINGNVYTQNAGINLTTNLTLGNNAGATAIYNMTNGTLTASTNLLVGNAGYATFNQSGGIVNAYNEFIVGNANTTTTSFYNLSGGTLNGLFEVVGNFGVGLFNQSGGVHNLSDRLDLGAGPGGFGVYNLTGGTLSLTPSSFIGIGELSNGQFNQNGGVLNAPTGQVFVGYGSYAGTFTLSGAGQATIANFFIGQGSNAAGAVFQSGGTITASQLVLGNSSATYAIYNMSGGVLNASSEIHGAQNGTSSFYQTGGSHVVTGAGTLTIGYGTNSNSTFTLDNTSGASSLTVPTEIIGLNGSGAFIQNNGVHAAGFISIAANPNSNGTLTLNNGTLTVGSVATPNGISIGSGGNNAVFNQNGGVLSIPGFSGNISVGILSSGYFNLKGGTAAADIMTLGNFGYGGPNPAGYATQSGGTLTLNGYYGALAVGYVGLGSYVLNTNNGPSLLNAIQETIANGGTGTFYHNGGVNSTNTLSIGVNNGGNGFYDLSGPGILIAPLLEIGQYGGNGTFSQYAGTVTAGGTGVYVNTPGSSGPALYNLFGGTLTATEVYTYPEGTFNQTAGVENGYFLNQGNLVYSGGIFNGTLENALNGSVTLTSILTAGGGIFNRGTIVVPLGGGLAAPISAIVDNENNLTLAGGTLTGAGNILNNGFLSGYGVIAGTGGLLNNSVLSQGAGNITLSNTGAIANYGEIVLAVGHQFQLYGASVMLANYAAFYLNGATVGSNGTLYNSSSGVISGPGTIASILTNFGTIQANLGTIRIINAWTNNGVLVLNGLGSSITGGVITNAAAIQGVGTVAANVTNSTGTLEALGGALVFTGTVNNAATMRTTSGSKILMQGSANIPTNAGLIDLAGGTFDNGGQPLTNNGSIAGWGVFSSGGLTNNGSVNFTGGTSTINGTVANTSGHTINIKYQPAIFTALVTNNAGATIKTTGTTVTYVAGSVNNGTYTSDPSTNIFQASVINGASGTMTGGIGDVFTFTGGSVTNNGIFTNGGNLNSSVNFTNTGTYTQSGPQAWSAGTTFTNNGGTANFQSDAGSVAASPLTVQVNAGLVTFSAAQHLNALNISGGQATVTANTFAVANGTTIAPAGTLQVGIGGTTGALTSGNVSNNGLLGFNCTDALAVSNLITGTGTITQAGTGTTTLSNYSGTGLLNVTSGMLQFSTTAAARRTSAVLVQTNSLTITNGTGTSVLDLTNHDMMVTGLGTSSYSTFQSLVFNGIANLGLGNGNPAGPQITSSSANNNPNASTFILPYSIDNTFGGGVTGDGSGIGFSDPNYTNGIAVTKPGTAFVKYLYFGDLNLDGVVNAADIFQEVGNVGLTTPGLADYGTSYLNGDLLGSGSVTTADIFLVVGSLGFGSGGPNNGPLGGLDGGSLGIAATGSSSAATPEPASLALLGLGTVGLLIRRKRRTN